MVGRRFHFIEPFTLTALSEVKMNQEFTVTLKQIVIIWFTGFATGAPFMNILLNVKYDSPVILPVINFLVMAGISGTGLFLFLKKEAKKEKSDEHQS